MSDFLSSLLHRGREESSVIRPRLLERFASGPEWSAGSLVDEAFEFKVNGTPSVTRPAAPTVRQMPGPLTAPPNPLAPASVNRGSSTVDAHDERQSAEQPAVPALIAASSALPAPLLSPDGPVVVEHSAPVPASPYPPVVLERVVERETTARPLPPGSAPTSVAPREITVLERHTEREIVERVVSERVSMERATSIEPGETAVESRAERQPLAVQTHLAPLPVTTLERAASAPVPEAPPPAVQVTIGRVEVRVTPPAALPRPSRPAGPALPLDEYLRRRDRGR